jgi:hypothetical protein
LGKKRKKYSCQEVTYALSNSLIYQFAWCSYKLLWQPDDSVCPHRKQGHSHIFTYYRYKDWGNKFASRSLWITVKVLFC